VGVFLFRQILAVVLAAISATPALAGHKATLTVLYDFKQGADGGQPYGTLLFQDGALYGTAGYGGKPACPGGCGKVFKVTIANPAETALYDFKGNEDGRSPQAGLAADGGEFVGTTPTGGGMGCGGAGCGTVFEVNATSGTEKVLHRFAGGSDGATPLAGLVRVGNAFYGTTSAGGGTGCSGKGCGTVFKIGATSWATSIVYRFSGGADGSSPSAGLIYAHGMLYGTTSGGGSAGYGTVFQIARASGKETVLYSFTGGDDGADPVSAVTQVGGVLYGTTLVGGGTGCYGVGCGTVFKVDPTSSAETVLHRFGTEKDGTLPQAALIKVGGLLYGTTNDGGSRSYGTIFDINPSTGTEKVLYDFDGPNGATPSAGLIYQGGSFFGATASGGGHGSVYAFTP